MGQFEACSHEGLHQFLPDIAVGVVAAPSGLPAWKMGLPPLTTRPAGEVEPQRPDQTYRIHAWMPVEEFVLSTKATTHWVYLKARNQRPGNAIVRLLRCARPGTLRRGLPAPRTMVFGTTGVAGRKAREPEKTGLLPLFSDGGAQRLWLFATKPPFCCASIAGVLEMGVAPDLNFASKNSRSAGRMGDGELASDWE